MPAARNRVWNVLLRAVSLGSALLLLLALAAVASPRLVGLYGLFVASLSWMVLLVGLDAYTFTQRALATAGEAERRGLFGAHARAILPGYLLALPIIAGLFSRELLPAWMLGWFLALLPSEHLAQECQRGLLVLRRPLAASILLFLRSGAWILVILPIVLINPQLVELPVIFSAWLVGSLSAGLVGSLLLWRMAPAGTAPGPVPRIRQVLRTGLVFFVATLAFRLLLTGDRHVAEIIGGGDYLGIYVLFVALAIGIVNILDPAIYAFSMPDILAAGRQGGPTALDAEVRRSFRQAGVLGLLLAVGIGLFLPPLLEFVDSPEYLDQLHLLWILLAGGVAYGAGLAFHYGLYSLHAERLIVISHLSGLLLFGAVAWVLAGIDASLAVPVALSVALAWVSGFKWLAFRQQLTGCPDPARESAG